MKTCRMSEAERHERRLDIMEKRDTMIADWRRRGRSVIAYKTTRKVFKTSLSGKVSVSHDQKPYPHSSTRQRARYARQIAAGQLRMEGVTGPTAGNFLFASGSKEILKDDGHRRFVVVDPVEPSKKVRARKTIGSVVQ